MKKIIFALFIILILLLIGISVFTQLGKNEISNKPFEKITGIPNYSQSTTKNKLTASITHFTQPEVSKLDSIASQTPIDTDDFTLNYSPLTNKYYVQYKTTQGKDAFSNWKRDNALDDVLKNQEVVIEISDTTQTQSDQEIIVQQTKEQVIIVTPVPPPFSPDSENSPEPTFPFHKETRILTELLDAIMKPPVFPTAIPPISGQPEITIVPPDITILPTKDIEPPEASLSLSILFQEIGAKVGVPPKILSAVLQIEYPPTFNYTSEQVNQYSQPGNTIPGCGPNVCSATGPMQMTIGIDGNGLSSCPQCCWKDSCLNTKGGCPNAWASYGGGVNTYGGYTHQSNPCNLRDNIYAAAAKLKRDSGATDPVNWTQDQTYRAALRYYGSCSDTARYARLGNRTYCEYVWWYYTTQ